MSVLWDEPRTDVWARTLPIERYRALLAAMVVTVFFSRLDYYLFAWIWAVPPLWWMILFGVMAAPVALFDFHRGQLVTGYRVSWYAVAWLGLVVVFGLLAHTSITDMQPIRTAVLSGMLILLFSVLFRGSAVSAARVAVLAVTSFAVGINIIEALVVPGFFSEMNWRTAGLYINPNGSASAILLGMILGLPAIPERRRVTWLALCGSGIGLTLSRAGMFCWLLALFILILRRQITWKGLVVSVAIAVMVNGAVLTASGAIGNPDVQARIGFSLLDYSAEERSELGLKAIYGIVNAPILGHGLSAMYLDRMPHNLYLRFWYEMGITGLGMALIFPLLPLMGRRRAVGSFALVFSGALAVWALFDHNVLDNPVMLIAVALQCAYPRADANAQTYD